MIGFLKKDLYMLYMTYRKNLVLIFLIYAVVVLTMKVTFLLGMIVWLMSFYTLSVITMDNSCGWDRYARTLPVSSGAIILARFLADFVMMCAGVVFAVAIALLLHFFMDYDDITGLMVMIALVTATALITTGLMFPAAYKWGVEKARNTTLVLFMLVCTGPAVISKWTGTDFLEETADYLLEISFAQLSVWALVIGLLVFVFGGWLSSRIYAKKEF